MSGGAELPLELDRLAREFVARERAGERPTISEYVRRYPEYEAGIREVFPVLAVMEGVKPPTGSGRLGRARTLDPEVRRLGDYELRGVVGRGGMGVVYEAVQATLGRRVALKVLPPQATMDERFVERFRIEAQAAARLEHPNIVPVIGLGEDDGVHYYAMQFIEGCGLDEVLEATRSLLEGTETEAPRSASQAALRLFATDLDEGPSGASPDEGDGAPEPLSTPPDLRPASRAARRRFGDNVARIGLQAAEALAFAHARGVLHRDIKPSNIMLDANGRAWITDFGLCRQEESDGLTRTGDIVGTLRYMAPESFGGVHDVRGDVYGLGLTLYELLAAAPAYDDTNRAALIQKVTQTSPPRLRSHDPSIPEDLATIVHKAIARDPEMRYPTADALVADLRAYLEGRPIAARAPSLGYVLRATFRRHRPLAVTVLGSLVLLVAGAIFYVISVKEKEAQARLEHYAANIAAAETALRDGDLPLARRLLARAPSEFRGWEWRLLQSRLVPGVRSFDSLSPHAALAVAHSPDGRWVAISSAAAIHVFDHETGERVRTLARGAQDLDWSPDGTRLAGKKHFECFVFSWPEGKELWRRGANEWWRDVCYDRSGAWLYAGSEDCQVHVLDARTHQEIATVSVDSKVRSVAGDASGRFLLVGRLDGQVSLVDTDDWRVVWTQRASARGLLNVAVVDDRFIAATSVEGAVHVFHLEDGRLHVVLPHEGTVWDVAAAPRGPLLATARRGGRLSLWNVETGRRLATWHHGRHVQALSFHPAGDRVVTASYAGTIHEWSAHPGRDDGALVSEVDGVICLATQPGGGALVATGETGGIVRLWDMDTSELVRAWPQHAGWVRALAFSPDGAYLASADAATPPTIQIRRLADGRVVHRLAAHAGAARALAYTPDGAALVSAGDDGAISVWDPVTGARVQHVSISKTPLFALAVGSQGLVAVGGADRAIRILDAATWTVRAELRGHEGTVRGLAFHPAGSLLASVSADQTIRVWDATTGETRRVLSEPDPDLGTHTEVVQCVAFHPDGSRLATAARNTTVVIWDWTRGQAVATLRGHTSWVNGIAFSGSGDTLASAGSDRALRLTDVRPPAQRAVHLGRAAAARREAEPRVEQLLAMHDDVDRVIEALRTDRTLSAAHREAALRRAHARRDTLAGWRRWAWRILSRPDADPHDLRRAMTVGGGMLRFADLRALHHPEAYVIVGAAKHRLRLQPVRGYMDRALTMDAQGTDVHGKAMAFLALAFTREGDLKQAGYWMLRLKSLLATSPGVDTPVVRALHDEAWATYSAQRGR